MKGSYLLVICAIVVGLASFSCRKSAAPCNTFGWSFEAQDEIVRLSEASQAYSNDPSSANCEAYRKAYLDYIDSLRGWERCLSSPAERESWQEELDEAERDVMDLQC